MMVIIEHTHKEEHLHKVDPSFTTKTNYYWTPNQEAIIRTGILSNTKRMPTPWRISRMQVPLMVLRNTLTLVSLTY